MDNIVEEKLYRIARKKDCHVNTKLNPDGSKAAIQFTDAGNDLSGPVNLIEVGEGDLIRGEYIPLRDEPRSLKEIVLQDVVAPVMRELLYQAMMEGYEKLSDQIKTKAIPTLKAKSQSFAKNAGTIASGIKDGLAGEKTKALKLVNENTVVQSSFQPSNVEIQQKSIRSKEEIASIVRTMRLSAVTLAACIRMLNNTVMADDESDPQLHFEIQRNLQTLTTSDVMKQIDLLLADKNRALLDESDLVILSSFKEGYFWGSDRKVPISKYLSD